jgi:Tol biopolymer transport system component
MKNLLRSTLYLCVFALAGILFQISCSSDSMATNATPVGKIVYEKGDGIWTANYDGTAATQIPIVLPANVSFFFGTLGSSISVSPDGNTVFFTCSNAANSFTATELYSCDITGGNATAVVQISDPTSSIEHIGHAVAF